MGMPAQWKVVWREETDTLKLDGEEVLHYRLCWPQLEGSGLGARWMNRCYTMLARRWRKRWRQEVYCHACLELAQRRAEARPFTPWRGELGGQVTTQEEGLLSLCMEGLEERGDGKPCRIRWGDVWKVEEGAPCPLKELLPPGRGWKKNLYRQIIQEGERRQREGEWVPDPDWRRRIRRAFPEGGFCLQGKEVELAFPQCSIAPAAEGTPLFRIPRREKEEQG